MKNLIYLIVIVTLFGCTKEEYIVIPQEEIIVKSVSNNVLSQVVNGTVIASHSFQLKVYEDFGGGEFELTIDNIYTNNSFPYSFQNTINRPFYFELTLHNSSTFSNSGKGLISSTITYNDTQIVFLEADENTWSENYTSAIYNN